MSCVYVCVRACMCVRKNECHGLDDYETRSHRILGGIFNLLLGGDGVKQTFIKNEDREQRQSLLASCRRTQATYSPLIHSSPRAFCQHAVTLTLKFEPRTGAILKARRVTCGPLSVRSVDQAEKSSPFCNMVKRRSVVSLLMLASWRHFCFLLLHNKFSNHENVQKLCLPIVRSLYNFTLQWIQKTFKLPL